MQASAVSKHGHLQHSAVRQASMQLPAATRRTGPRQQVLQRRWCQTTATTAGPTPSAPIEAFTDLQQRPNFTDLASTQRMVETSMLAAVGGLAYTVATVLRLTSYLVYFMPLPVVLSARRNGPEQGQMTAVTTSILLMVLLGPIQAATYILNYGVVGTWMGICWTRHFSWQLVVLSCAILRVAGQLGMLALSSWAMNENLLTITLHSLHDLLDQCAAALGMTGAPEPAVIAGIAIIMVMLNSLLYMSMMQVIYTVFFRSMGMPTPRMPKFIEKRFPQPT